MNPKRQAWNLFLTAIFAVAFCCQCETTPDDEPEIITSLEGGSKFGKLGQVRKVGLKRESGYKIAGDNDHELASGKKSEGAERISSSLNNEKVIKNSKGEVVRVEKKKDLYGDSTASETGKNFDSNKVAKFKKSDFATKEFKTPEYLSRQEFATTDFKDGSTTANESKGKNLFSKNLFKTTDSTLFDKTAKENGTLASGFDKTFKTKTNSSGQNAITQSVVPIGAGYQEDVTMSMDDVKKLINPGSARD